MSSNLLLIPRVGVSGAAWSWVIAEMAEKNKRNIGPLLIILAGCFWGSMGIFVRRLGTYGFTSAQIVCIRVTLAALFFSVLLLIKDRSGFRIALRDLPLFLALGFGSILFFTVCYFTAITMMPLLTVKPSISVNSWLSVCSRSSWPPPRPAPR